MAPTYMVEEMGSFRAHGWCWGWNL